MKLPTLLAASLALALSSCIVVRYEAYGAEISDASPTPVGELLAAPEAFDGQRVVVEGTVDEVCKTKGCWMTLTDGDESMRVRFRDYGFFLPTDCDGDEVRFEGVFAIETISVEDARHYLEDAGRTEEAAAITEPQRGYSFLADGVRLFSTDE